MDKLAKYIKIFLKDSNGALLPKDRYVHEELQDIFIEIFIDNEFIGSGSDKKQIRMDVTNFSKDVRIALEKIKKIKEQETNKQKEEVNG